MRIEDTQGLSGGHSGPLSKRCSMACTLYCRVFFFFATTTGVVLKTHFRIYFPLLVGVVRATGERRQEGEGGIVALWRCSLRRGKLNGRSP